MRHSVSAIFIVGLTVLGSLALACATPFAAIAALAAGSAAPLPGLGLVILAWLSNQIIGFAILGYPMTADTFAWGVAIGLAATLAFFASRIAMARAGRSALGKVSAFLASFFCFELTLYASGLLIGSAADAFSLVTVGRIFAISLGTFIAVLILDRILAAVSPSGLTANPVPSTR